MRITFKNSFHGTEYSSNLKSLYFEDSDPMIALQCRKAQDKDLYAIRKLKEITTALCPNGQHGCACTCAINK